MKRPQLEKIHWNTLTEKSLRAYKKQKNHARDCMKKKQKCSLIT